MGRGKMRKEKKGRDGEVFGNGSREETAEVQQIKKQQQPALPAPPAPCTAPPRGGTAGQTVARTDRTSAEGRKQQSPQPPPEALKSHICSPRARIARAAILRSKRSRGMGIPKFAPMKRSLSARKDPRPVLQGPLGARTVLRAREGERYPIEPQPRTPALPLALEV